MAKVTINIDSAALISLDRLIAAGEDCVINIAPADFQPGASRPSGFYESVADDILMGKYGNEPERTPNLIAAGIRPDEIPIIQKIVNSR